jgi:hypothetical protein
MNRVFDLGKVSEEVQGLTDQKDGGGQYFGGNVHKGSEDDEMEREDALSRSNAKNHYHVVNQSLYNMEEVRSARTILHTNQNGQVETFELKSWGNVLQALNGDYGIRFGDPESSDTSISSEEALNEGIAVITNDGRLAFSWEGPTNPILTRPKHENMLNANDDSDEEQYRETFNNSGADDVLKGCPCGFCHQAARRLEQIRCPECRRYHMAHPVGSPGFNECVHISQAISLLAQEDERTRLTHSIERLEAQVERLKNLRKVQTRHLDYIETEEKEKLQAEAPDEADKPSLKDVREAIANERHPGYEQERVEQRLRYLAAAVGPHDEPGYSPCSSPEYSPCSSPEPPHLNPDNTVEKPEKKRPKLGLAGPNLPKASRRFHKGTSAQVKLALSETWDPDKTMNDDGSLNTVPVLKTKVQANVIGFELRRELISTDNIRVASQVRLQSARIEHDISSPLFTMRSPVLLDFKVNGKPLRQLRDEFRSELPQTNPWYEHNISIGIKGARAFQETISIEAGIAYTKIARNDYIEHPLRHEVTDNFRLDVSLIWATPKDSALYLKGFATTHNTLGYEPITYNRKSSSQFNKKYGEVAIGFIKFW